MKTETTNYTILTMPDGNVVNQKTVTIKDYSRYSKTWHRNNGPATTRETSIIVKNLEIPTTKRGDYIKRVLKSIGYTEQEILVARVLQKIGG